MHLNKATLPNSEHYKNKNLLWVLVVSFVYQCIFASQGFDFVDTGYLLTFYQNIFHSPSCVSSCFVYYLMGVMGGGINMIVGDGGILAFRIAGVFIRILSFYLLFQIVRKYVSERIVLYAIALLTIIVSRLQYVFHYNDVTELICLYSIYLILRDTESGNAKRSFWVGLLLAINVFVRIPNIVLLSFFVLYIIDFIYAKDRILIFRRTLGFVAGVITGVLFIFGVMLALGHFTLFVDSMSQLFNAASSTENTHSLSKLISVYLNEYSKIAIETLKYVTLYLAIFLIDKYIKQKYLALLLYFLAFIVGLVIRPDVIYSIYSVAMIGILYWSKHYSVLKIDNKSHALLSVSGLLMMLLLPVGSDWGILNVGMYSMWISFVFFIDVLFNNWIHIGTLQIKNYRYVWLIYVVSLIATGIFTSYNSAYFDGGSRRHKLYRVHNKLATVLTSKERVINIDEMLKELNKYVKQGDELFAYNGIATVYYLTETKPYLDNPLCFGMVGAKHFDQKIKEKENLGKLPVVLVQRFETIGPYWYKTDRFLNEKPFLTDAYADPKLTKIMNLFLQRHDYHIVWKNDYWLIMQARK